VTADPRTKAAAAPRITSELAKALTAAGLTVEPMETRRTTGLEVNALAWVSVDPESSFGTRRAGITLQPKSYGAFRKRMWDWSYNDHNGVELESKIPKVVEAVVKGLAEIVAKREAAEKAHQESLAAEDRAHKAFAAVGVQMTGASVHARGGLSAYARDGLVMVRFERTLYPEEAAKLFAALQGALASLGLGGGT
jgi:hypothetical protein